MSINIVEAQIRDFLSTDTPGVLAIKGHWGVGKTCFWNEFLLEAKRDNRIPLKKYSYVSLFGLNSLDAFKFSIFEHVIDKEVIGSNANLKTFLDNMSNGKLLEISGRKMFSAFKHAPVLRNFTGAIESLSFLSLSKTLICIDDVERSGSKLSIKDVLGLVSQLKEEKQCKIVLILNDEKELTEEYENYREKVVDIELRFSPTAEESAKKAFGVTNEVLRTLPPLTEKLGINNIRILKKIERLVTLAHSYCENYELEVFEQVTSSLVLFVWCYYGNEKGPECLDKVTKRGYDLSEFEDEDKNKDKDVELESILNTYDYRYTDEFDLILAEAVRSGYFIEDEFHREAILLNNKIKASKSAGSHADAWSFYNSSFKNNKEELIEKLYESLKKNALNITPSSLNALVKLFKNLDEESKASEMIDFYIIARNDEKELFNMKEINFFGDIKDEELIIKFNETYIASIVKEDAFSVLGRLIKKNGWHPDDVVILAKTTADEYYALFKAINDEDLYRYVKQCLYFGKLSNANEDEIKITKNATIALNKIANESKLNKLRVSNYINL